MTNQEIRLQNEMVSKRNQQRAFLQRKLTHFEHTTPRNIATRSKHRRMASIYRRELEVLEAA